MNRPGYWTLNVALTSAETIKSNTKYRPPAKIKNDHSRKKVNCRPEWTASAWASVWPSSDWAITLSCLHCKKICVRTKKRAKKQFHSYHYQLAISARQELRAQQKRDHHKNSYKLFKLNKKATIFFAFSSSHSPSRVI